MTAPSIDDVELPAIAYSSLPYALAELGPPPDGGPDWIARMSRGYVVTTYADTTAILRDQRFHSAVNLSRGEGGAAEAELARRREATVVGAEGETHTRLKRFLTSLLSRGAIDDLRPVMRETVHSLLDAVDPAEGFDLVGDICTPFPFPTIARLLDVGIEDWETFSRWAEAGFGVYDGDADDKIDVIDRCAAEMESYIDALLDERRTRPGADIVSRMLAHEVTDDGRASEGLTTLEISMLVETFFTAGVDTVRNQLACLLEVLLSHLHEWQALVDDPSLGPAAVEEGCRYAATLRITSRTASEDIEYRGLLFERGTVVNLLLAAGNHDERAWADPGQLDVRRTPVASNHLAFGGGRHYCAGAALARAQLEEALGVLVTRVPGMRLTGEPIQWKPPRSLVWGPTRLDVSV